MKWLRSIWNALCHWMSSPDDDNLIDDGSPTWIEADEQGLEADLFEVHPDIDR